jgi:uncharacterized protein YeaO (DUF488 family)
MSERVFVGLHTKCIKAPIENTDGIRFSTMSTHNLPPPHGKTPDQEITSESYDWWLQELAPAKSLVYTWYKELVNWEEFEAAYRHMLAQSEKQEVLKELIDLAKKTIVTVLCVEETPYHCHRQILAEVCSQMDQELVVEVH